ncbi:MAG: hypothetical protein MJH09_09850 [Cetobacterium sp.]|nr:hypothetical protein [Cetobacterium sp.]
MPITQAESTKSLSREVKDRSRAYESLIEEIEAIEWYDQRADVCTNDELKKVLVHNMNEEIEHATMLFEWLRRNVDVLDENMKKYLFTKKSIVEIEEEEGECSCEGQGSLGLGDLK